MKNINLKQQLATILGVWQKNYGFKILKHFMVHFTMRAPIPIENLKWQFVWFTIGN